MERTIQREIITVNGRTLVEFVHVKGYEKKVIKYAVVRGFMACKPTNEKWDYAIEYFPLFNFDYDVEKAKEAALKCLMSIPCEVIPYARLSELATLFKDRLIKDDEDSAIECFDDVCEMTDEEKKYFGIKLNKKYDIWEVEVKRVQKKTVKVALPTGCNYYDAIKEVEDYEYNIDWDTYDVEEEIDDYDADKVKEDLSEDDVENEDELWNDGSWGEE